MVMPRTRAEEEVLAGLQQAHKKREAEKAAASAEYQAAMQAWRDAVANRERLLFEANQHVHKARSVVIKAKARAAAAGVRGVR